MKKYLLVLINKPNLRSAIINGAIVALVALADALTAQVNGTGFSFTALYGAVSVAVVKYVHSAATRNLLAP